MYLGSFKTVAVQKKTAKIPPPFKGPLFSAIEGRCVQLYNAGPYSIAAKPLGFEARATVGLLGLSGLLLGGWPRGVFCGFFMYHDGFKNVS